MITLNLESVKEVVYVAKKGSDGGETGGWRDKELAAVWFKGQNSRQFGGACG